MKTGKYDIGFAQDADADRLVILDEKGHFIADDPSTEENEAWKEEE